MNTLNALYLEKESSDLEVTLTGMQWHCILTQLAGEPLTPLGHSILRAGCEQMITQLRFQCSLKAHAAERA